MTTFTRTVTESFQVETCCVCGVAFAMPQAIYEKVHNTQPGSLFYCPNGHGQHYNTKSYQTRITELERQTIRLREERDTALAAKEKAAKATTLLKKQVKNGVCPCCHRTFRQLKLHMKHQHPEFAEKAEEK